MMLAKALICCLYISALGPADHDSLPVCVQFSPVPSGPGWRNADEPLTDELIRATIDNILDHGFTGIEAPPHRSPEEDKLILSYAQSRGMFVSAHVGSVEIFGRDAPSPICVYSKDYAIEVERRVRENLKSLNGIPRLYNIFPFQDEPFHAGPKSFDMSQEVKDEFRRRYGYDLPEDLGTARENPRAWLDLLNFHSDNFSDGWRQAYRILKSISPEVTVTLTHDSHNTLGGGFGSHTELAIDDVFHWGGDFADMYVFDIYPYMSIDFRFGEPSKFLKPRIAQTHYTMAQMRNLTTHYNKIFGFWVETYNPDWFTGFIDESRRLKHWTEREISLTAVAQGADYLLTGHKIPIDAGHWESFGQGLNLLKKAGKDLLAAPKKQAAAAMLFPRTQLLQLQEEYADVSLSYELFLRAFGELDILHEEQITDDTLKGYQILVLFDVRLLPSKTMRHLKSFVEKGGMIIADSLPTLDEYHAPNPLMEELFGVRQTSGGRILRQGHWVGYENTYPPTWHFRDENALDEIAAEKHADIQGTFLGKEYDLKVTSPRLFQAGPASAHLADADGQCGLAGRTVGQGKVFLFGFCMLDTFFSFLRTGNQQAVDELAGLVRAVARSEGHVPNVCSSNPDIEASLRVGQNSAFLFLINHEGKQPEIDVELKTCLPDMKRITDLEDGAEIPFTRKDSILSLSANVPEGECRIFRLE